MPNPDHETGTAPRRRLMLTRSGAALAAVLAASLPVRGADREFALVALSNGQTIPDAGRYGAIVANGPGFPGRHFAPFAGQRDLVAGRYRLVGEANTLGAATTYVPPEPSQAPALTSGQPLLRVAQTGSGEISPTTDVVLLSAIDTERHPRRLTLRAPYGTSSGASLAIDSDADLTHLPGLRPIEADVNSVLAQRAFSGRDAWTLGTVVLHCPRTPNVSILLDGATRVRIEGITRVANIPSFHAVGQQNAWNRDSESSFWTIDPLVVVVRVPDSARARVTASIISGSAAVALDPPAVEVPRPAMLAGCSVGTSDLSDLWELERTFTTVAPQAHRSWSSSVRRAVATGHIRLGMPREAVAYVAGYPTSYGTKAEMDRQTDWNYSLPAPFSFRVRFDGSGRVRAYEPPGELP